MLVVGITRDNCDSLGYVFSCDFWANGLALGHDANKYTPLEPRNFGFSSDAAPVTRENRQIFEGFLGFSGAEDAPLHCPLPVQEDPCE